MPSSSSYCSVLHSFPTRRSSDLGFNYGKYVKMDYPDSITHYDIAGYYLTELPDRLRPYENGALRGMSPSSMTKYALDQARAQMQVRSEEHTSELQSPMYLVCRPLPPTALFYTLSLHDALPIWDSTMGST